MSELGRRYWLTLGYSWLASCQRSRPVTGNGCCGRTAVLVKQSLVLIRVVIWSFYFCYIYFCYIQAIFIFCYIYFWYIPEAGFNKPLDMIYYPCYRLLGPKTRDYHGRYHLLSLRLGPLSCYIMKVELPRNPRANEDSAVIRWRPPCLASAEWAAGLLRR